MKKVYKNKQEIVKSKLDEAKAVIEAENKAIVEKCVNEYNEAVKPILEKYGCSLVVQGQFQGDKVQSSIVIVKNP